MAKPTELAGLGGPTPLGDASLALVLARLFDVRRREPALLAGRDPDAVHDLRVATRRLRAAIRLFGKKALRHTDVQVERLQDALGEVRDLQLLRAWLERARVPSRERPALDEIDGALAQRQDQADRRLSRALDRWIQVGAPAVTRAAHRVRTKGTLGAPATVARLDRPLRKVERARHQALAADGAPGPLHAFRIRLKRLRYQLGLLSAALPPSLARMLATIVPLLEEAGALHDLDVRIALLASAAHPPPVLLRRLRDDRARGWRRLAAELTEWGARPATAPPPPGGDPRRSAGTPQGGRARPARAGWTRDERSPSRAAPAERTPTGRAPC